MCSIERRGAAGAWPKAAGARASTATMLIMSLCVILLRILATFASSIHFFVPLLVVSSTGLLAVRTRGRWHSIFVASHRYQVRSVLLLRSLPLSRLLWVRERRMDDHHLCVQRGSRDHFAQGQVTTVGAIGLFDRATKCADHVVHREHGAQD